MRTGILIVALIILSGCVSTSKQMVAAGYDPAYAKGFEDGKTSGEVAAGYPYAAFTKDVRRAAVDPQYGSGWQDGFNVGKGQYEALRPRR